MTAAVEPSACTGNYRLVLLPRPMVHDQLLDAQADTGHVRSEKRDAFAGAARAKLLGEVLYPGTRRHVRARARGIL